MKIVVLDGYTENPGDLSWDALGALGDLTVYDKTPAEQIVPRIGGAVIILVNKTPITAETMDACRNLLYIGVLATGYNVVDTAYARQKGIVVTNIPTYGTTAVAQYTMALLLEICHHVAHHSDAVHQGRWEKAGHFCFWDYPLMELAGKTMGFIGFGRIGQAAAALAKAFGMKILAYDVTQNESGRALAEYVSLNALLAGSDVISLHCPLTDESKGIINTANIAKMKDGVILINTSRGPLIAEQDLADALNAGKVYAAGVDVVSTEPIRPDNPLLKAKNCFITPHIAWAPKESRQRLMNVAVENVRQFIKGTPQNQV